MDPGLSGKVVMVTGGGSGIGEAIVLRLAEEGATVVAADLNGDNAKAVAAQAGPSAEGVTLDIGVAPLWWTPEHCAEEVSTCRRNNRRTRRSTAQTARTCIYGHLEECNAQRLSTSSLRRWMRLTLDDPVRPPHHPTDNPVVSVQKA